MIERQTSPVPVRFLQSLKTLIHIIYCFIVLYLFFLIFLLPMLFLICFRLILSILFSTFYKRRYKLTECANACFGLDRFAHVYTLYYFAYIEGSCDIEVLRERIHRIFATFKGKNGSRPYEVMLCSLVKKFGFYCWENVRDSFDINYHIRYFPGCSDPNRIYTETEVFQAAAKLVDDLWPESRPRWEFLVVPRMKKDNSDIVCSAIHFRLQHAYGDGISIGQIVRLCAGDQPPPDFIYDPVHPPIPPTPLWMKLITFLQVIFLGPWATLNKPPCNESNAYLEGPLVGEKYFGRTTIDIPIKKIRDVRKYYKCSTTAIQHYAFTGAMRKLAERKGCPIPEYVLANVNFALLPYPHEYPQNRISFTLQKSPIGRDGLDRLYATEELCKRIAHPMNYYTLLTTRLFMQITGLFPAFVISKLFGSIQFLYYVSNVPGIKDRAYFNGNEVLNEFGTGPLTNGTRYVAGVTCYANKFTFGFSIKQSKLVEDREDCDYFIRAFENEMKDLMDSVTGNSVFELSAISPNSPLLEV